MSKNGYLNVRFFWKPKLSICLQIFRNFKNPSKPSWSAWSIQLITQNAILKAKSNFIYLMEPRKNSDIFVLPEKNFLTFSYMGTLIIFWHFRTLLEFLKIFLTFSDVTIVITRCEKSACYHMQLVIYSITCSVYQTFDDFQKN